MIKKIGVLIVDDSASVRQVLSEILGSDNEIEVIAASSDPIIAMKQMEKRWPDVIISDIEMPRKDGLTFVREIMASHPTPVIICSALTERNAGLSVEAMSAGAVSVISKPGIGAGDFLHESSMLIIDAVKSASNANVKNLGIIKPAPLREKLSPDVFVPNISRKPLPKDAEKIIAVGASTGGPQAIESILQSLPEGLPGIVIVQHMPEKFTGAFAKRLDSCCPVSVKEAVDNEKIERGTVYIAPGNRHLLIRRDSSGYHTIVKDGPLISRHRPSVDVLFRSVAQNASDNALGIILTGMGDDGAIGMLEMKAAGAKTIAQDKKTSVVFGMPGEAVKKGAVDKIVPIDTVFQEIINFSN